jgi:hypothetical protein
MGRRCVFRARPTKKLVFETTVIRSLAHDALAEVVGGTYQGTGELVADRTSGDIHGVILGAQWIKSLSPLYLRK